MRKSVIIGIILGIVIIGIIAVLFLVKTPGSECKKLSNTPPAMSRDGCYIDLATKNSDPDLCEKVSTQPAWEGSISLLTKRDACYSVLATSANDISLCEKIADSAEKDNCRDLYHQARG